MHLTSILGNQREWGANCVKTRLHIRTWSETMLRCTPSGKGSSLECKHISMNIIILGHLNYIIILFGNVHTIGHKLCIDNSKMYVLHEHANP